MMNIHFRIITEKIKNILCHKSNLILFIFLVMSILNITHGRNNNPSKANVALPKPGLLGSWVTTHTCNNKKVFGLLNINKSTSTLKILDHNYKAVLEFEKSNFNKSGSIALIADKWLYKPNSRSGNFLSIDINANLDDTGLVINGKIKGQSACSDFVAYKYKSYGRRDIKKGIIKLKKLEVRA